MFDDYLCVFFAVDDPRNSKPAAIFDRMQFLGEFLENRYPNSFREHFRRNDILTVAQWQAIYQPPTPKKGMHNE